MACDYWLGIEVHGFVKGMPFGQHAAHMSFKENISCILRILCEIEGDFV